jgi:reactive intermediate/imine deaminase
MKKETIKTNNAPQAIGPYSQAVKVGDTIYLAGQIPLVPETMALENGDMRAQIRRVFENLAAVAKASGGSLQDVVKLNVYLTDLGHFPLVNEVMAQYFREPYPARAAVGVAALPKGATVEMDAVMVLGSARSPKKAKKKAKRSRR